MKFRKWTRVNSTITHMQWDGNRFDSDRFTHWEAIRQKLVVTYEQRGTWLAHCHLKASSRPQARRLGNGAPSCCIEKQDCWPASIYQVRYQIYPAGWQIYPAVKSNATWFQKRVVSIQQCSNLTISHCLIQKHRTVPIRWFSDDHKAFDKI